MKTDGFVFAWTALRIHLSEMTYQLLSKFSGYHVALRGSVIEMKASAVHTSVLGSTSAHFLLC